ncbi:MAG TPA: hypothetical protein VHO90_21340 [Bacteroidales bacterium]|nr:hypothetical protein [Bacteroidales bacterium]
MSKINEAGHAKNAANFDKLISGVTSYGEVYKPSRDALKLINMSTLSSASAAALKAVYDANSVYKNAVSARVVSFKPLSTLITRVMNALKACGVSEETVNQAREIARKIKGVRASRKLNEDEKTQMKASGTETKEISSSQMSFDNRVANFEKFTALLGGITLYAPNEEELKITALSTKLADMKAKNTAVINAETALNKARTERDKVFYAPTTGLVDIATSVKEYVKSIFSAESPQVKEQSKLQFRRY